MLTGPVPVTEKILADNGMTIDDIDLFEVNEAFASVVLRFMQAFGGSRPQAQREWRRHRDGSPAGRHRARSSSAPCWTRWSVRASEVGLATLCVASGMGAATIIERV